MIFQQFDCSPLVLSVDLDFFYEQRKLTIWSINIKTISFSHLMLPFSFTLHGICWIIFQQFDSSPPSLSLILDFFYEQKKLTIKSININFSTFSHLMLPFFHLLFMEFVEWSFNNLTDTGHNKNTTLKIIRTTLHFHSKRPHGQNCSLVDALTSGKIAMRSSSSNPNSLLADAAMLKKERFLSCYDDMSMDF